MLNPGGSEAAQRFARRCQSIDALLRRRLDAAESFHDLSRSELRSAQRSVRELAGRGVAPSPAEFWEQTAQPQGRNLVEASTQAIEGEINQLTKALQQFAAGVRLELRTDLTAGQEIALLDDHRRLAADGIDLVMSAVGRSDGINELGAWWQNRLRRRATLKATRLLLTSSLDRFDLIVTAAEMQLLQESPWSHGDRLLTAFELAHSDLREFRQQLERRLQRQARSMFDTVERDELRTEGHPVVAKAPSPITVVGDAESIDLAR